MSSCDTYPWSNFCDSHWEFICCNKWHSGTLEMTSRDLTLLHSVSYFFFLYWSPCSLLCTVFDSISSNVDQILLLNPSANVFFFGDFNVHHKDWLTYSGGTDKPGEQCYNFSTSNDFTQWTFLLGSLTVTLTVFLF